MSNLSLDQINALSEEDRASYIQALDNANAQAQSQPTSSTAPSSTPTMEDLITQIHHLTTQCQNLQSQQGATENATATLLAQILSRSSLPSSRPKLKFNPPEPFKGRDASSNKITNFLSQCQLYIDNTPGFDSDTLCISFAASYLKEDAYTWIASYLSLSDQEKEQPENIWLLSWNDFKEKLETTFGDPDKKASNGLKLHNLTQKGPASVYAAEFRRLSLPLNWNDEALKFIFLQGLKSELKDEFARIEMPSTLSSVIDRAIIMDARLYQRSRERKSNSLPTSYPSYSSATSSSTARREDKMDVDATHQASFRREPLSEDEKARRRAQGLCVYCGHKHDVNNCPLLAKKDSMKTAATFNITSPNNIPLGPKDAGSAKEE